MSTELNNASAIHRHRLKQEALSVAMAARAKGASFGEIELQLQSNGIDQGLLREIMMQVQGKTPQAQAQKNRSDMRKGVYWLVGGISVTLITTRQPRTLVALTLLHMEQSSLGLFSLGAPG